jgi:hypothetical protein
VITQPDPSTPYRFAEAPAPAAAPFDASEILATALRPHRAIDLVLVHRARFTRTVTEGRHLPALAGLMLLASVLFTLPYGAVLGLHDLWRVATLYLGSVAICFPSLHVFSGYLGCRMTLGQNLVIALVISAVAGMFVLGFAPILWFVELTTTAGSIATGTVSVVLLSGALVAGLGHVARTLMEDPSARPDRSYQVLMVAWQGLLVFVAYRMGDFLGLV